MEIRAYFFLNAVFFGNMNQGLEVDINIFLILCPCIINQDIYALNVRQFFIIPYIALIVAVTFMMDACI